MIKRFAASLLVAWVLATPVSAQSGKMSAQGTGLCNEVCGRLHNQYGDVIGYYCNQDSGPFGGGKDCVATPTGCSTKPTKASFRAAGRAQTSEPYHACPVGELRRP